MPNTFAQLHGHNFRIRQRQTPLPDRAAGSVSPHRGGLLSLVDLLFLAPAGTLTFTPEIDPVAIDNPFKDSYWHPGGLKPSGYDDLKYVINGFRVKPASLPGFSYSNCPAVSWRYKGGDAVSFSVRANTAGGPVVLSKSYPSGSDPDEGIFFTDDYWWDGSASDVWATLTSGDASAISIRFMQIPMGGLVKSSLPLGWTAAASPYEYERTGVCVSEWEAQRPITELPLYKTNAEPPTAGVGSSAFGSGMATSTATFDRLYIREGIASWDPAHAISVLAKTTHPSLQRVFVDGDEMISLSSPPDSVSGWAKWYAMDDSTEPSPDDYPVYLRGNTSNVQAVYSVGSPPAWSTVAAFAAAFYGTVVHKTDTVIINTQYPISHVIYVRVLELNSETIIGTATITQSSADQYTTVAISDPGGDESEPIRILVEVASTFSYPFNAFAEPRFFPPPFPVAHVDGSVIPGGVKENWLRIPPSSYNDAERYTLGDETDTQTIAPSGGPGRSGYPCAIITWESPATGWYNAVRNMSPSVVDRAEAFIGGNGFMTYDNGPRLTTGGPLVLHTYLTANVPGDHSLLPVVPSPTALSIGVTASPALSTAATPYEYLWLSFTAPGDASYRIKVWDSDVATDEMPEVFVGTDPAFLTWEGEPIGRTWCRWQPSPAPIDLLASPPSDGFGIYAVASGATGLWAGQDGRLAVGGGTGPDSWTFVAPAAGDWTTSKPRYRYDGSAWFPANSVEFVRQMTSGETVYMRVAGRWRNGADPIEGRAIGGEGWRALVTVA